MISKTKIEFWSRARRLEAGPGSRERPVARVGVQWRKIGPVDVQALECPVDENTIARFGSGKHLVSRQVGGVWPREYQCPFERSNPVWLGKKSHADERPRRKSRKLHILSPPYGESC